jgi:3-phenylpropionate/trans-cinnamate dioxygenase ferredoxin reductase subunit
VLLSDGETLNADLVVAGVGAVLNTGLAESAGLEVERGVVVDDYFQTSDPHIYAVGDIASFPDPIGGRVHLEHWDNALNQGRALGKTLAGEGSRFEHVAYFFSDLFDLTLNMVGYPAGWEDIIVRGEPADDRFTVVYVKDGRVRAALMVNDDEHFDSWTRLIEARQPVRPSLRDWSVAPLEAAS